MCTVKGHLPIRHRAGNRTPGCSSVCALPPASPLGDSVGMGTALIIISPLSEQEICFQGMLGHRLRLTSGGIQPPGRSILTDSGSPGVAFTDRRGPLTEKPPVSLSRCWLSVHTVLHWLGFSLRSVCLFLHLPVSDSCCLCLRSVYLRMALFLLLFVSLVLYVTSLSLCPHARPSHHLQQFKGLSQERAHSNLNYF